MMRHSSLSMLRVVSRLACAGILLILVGCAGRQISTSVQDQTLITPPPPPPPVVEAPVIEPPKVEEAKVEPQPIAPPPPPPPVEEPPPPPMEEPPPPPVEEPPPPVEEAKPEPAPPAPIEEAKAPEPPPPPPPLEEPKPEPAPPPPPPPPPPVEPLTLGDVFYDYDRALIRSDAISVLEQNARQLKANNNWSLEIEGHCDERGTLEYNLVLGEKRARAAKQYLQDLGVRGNQIRITSYGKEKPFCTEHSVECWQQNRRSHFVLK